MVTIAPGVNRGLQILLRVRKNFTLGVFREGNCRTNSFPTSVWRFKIGASSIQISFFG